MEEADRLGDIFVTLSGNKHVLARRHFELMKDGAVLSNSGHFNVEIDIPALEEIAAGRKERLRDYVDQYTLPSGRRVNLLGEGRLINLASAEGHPASVMDMSFANQALSAEYLVKEGKGLKRQVYPVPAPIDREIARLKLETMGVRIDSLTAEQQTYLSSWSEGTCDRDTLGPREVPRAHGHEPRSSQEAQGPSWAGPPASGSLAAERPDADRSQRRHRGPRFSGGSHAAACFERRLAPRSARASPPDPLPVGPCHPFVPCRRDRPERARDARRRRGLDLGDDPLPRGCRSRSRGAPRGGPRLRTRAGAVGGGRVARRH